eukprot:GHVN01060194.1.p1 GENE.GHVN01060194.1~~GHVN01060194.1.p1  ORF type:complete len:804 (-),score=151.05 GHVN01060194.1:5189-7600(-)
MVESHRKARAQREKLEETEEPPKKHPKPRDKESRFLETVKEFRSTEQLLNHYNELETREERGIVLGRILSMVDTQLVTLATEQKSSKIIETLIVTLCGEIKTRATLTQPAYTDEDELVNPWSGFCWLLRSLSHKLPNLICDYYASHVLQTALGMVPDLYNIPFITLPPKPAPKSGLSSSSKHEHTMSVDSEAHEEDDGDTDSVEGGGETAIGVEVDPHDQLEMAVLYFVRELQSGGTGFIPHTYHVCGSHVMRSLILCLGGYVNEPKDANSAGHRNSKARKSAHEEKVPVRQVLVPPSFTDKIVEIASSMERVINDEYLYDPMSSAFIQTLLQVTHADKRLGDVCSGLIHSIMRSGSSDEGDHAVNLCQSPVGSHLVEVVMDVMSKDNLTHLVLNCLRNKWGSLSTHGTGNYIVSKLTTKVDEPLLDIVLSELEPRAIISSNTAAVLWRCADACRRTRSNYRKFVIMVLEAVNCQSPSSLPYLWESVLTLTPHATTPAPIDNQTAVTGTNEEGSSTLNEPHNHPVSPAVSPTRFHPTGCSLLASLAYFPRQSVTPFYHGLRSFMKQSPEWLMGLTRDRQGSRLLEAIIKPGTSLLDTKACDRLIRKFEHHYVNMALDVRAAYVLTAFYAAGSAQVKTMIVKELLTIRDRVRDANYKVYVMCELGKYQDDKGHWESIQTKRRNAREIFSSIIAPMDNERTLGEDEKEEKRKRKRKRRPGKHSAQDGETSGAQPGAKEMSEKKGEREGKVSTEKVKREEREGKVDTALDYFIGEAEKKRRSKKSESKRRKTAAALVGEVIKEVDE